MELKKNWSGVLYIVGPSVTGGSENWVCSAVWKNENIPMVMAVQITKSIGINIVGEPVFKVT